MQNTLESKEWGRILALKTFKIEIQKRGANNSAVLQNWFPLKKLGPLFFNLWNLESLRKVLLNHAEYIEI